MIHVLSIDSFKFDVLQHLLDGHRRVDSSCEFVTLFFFCFGTLVGVGGETNPGLTGYMQDGEVTVPGYSR